MSTSKNMKNNANLPLESNLRKFSAKSLSPVYVHNYTLSQGCKYKRNTQDTKHVSNAYDQRLILIMMTIKNFFELLKKSFGTLDGRSANIYFLEYLEIFDEHIRAKLKDTQKMKFEKQRIINDILNKNDLNKINCQRLFIQLTKRISKFNEKCLIDKHKISVMDHRQLKFKKYIANKVKNDMYNGNMRIIKKSITRNEEEQNLTLDEKNTQSRYQKLLDKNIIEQKNLVEKKLKAEQTLAAILLKFDSNIGSRVAEIESIEGDINDKKQKFEKWKLLIAQQEANYAILMREKEEEELQYRNEKLEEIKLNHAAKVIQYSWKKYKINQRKAMKQNKTRNLKKNASNRMR